MFKLISLFLFTALSMPLHSIAQQITYPLAAGQSLQLTKNQSGWLVSFEKKDAPKANLLQIGELKWMTEFSAHPIDPQIQIHRLKVSQTPGGIISFGTQDKTYIFHLASVDVGGPTLYEAPPVQKPKSIQTTMIRSASYDNYPFVSFEADAGPSLTYIIQKTGEKVQIINDYFVLKNGDNIFFKQNGNVYTLNDHRQINLEAPTISPSIHRPANTQPALNERSQFSSQLRSFGHQQEQILKEIASSNRPETQAQSVAPANNAKAIDPNALKRIEIEYAEQKYLVYMSDDPKNPGTFVRRESDGKTVKISIQSRTMQAPDSHHLQALSLNEGILSHPQLSRQIDLEAFDLEAKFIPTREATIGVEATDQNGQPIKKQELVRDWADREFTDVRNDGERVIEPVSARQDLVNSVYKSVLKETKANSILVGDAGDSPHVVRTALQQLPRTWKTYSLDPSVLGAEAKFVGAKQTRVKEIRELNLTLPVVWYSENISVMAGVGATESDPADFLTSLASDIEKGKMKIVGSSTDDYNDRITNSAVRQALQVTSVDDLKAEQVVESLELFLKTRSGAPRAPKNFLDYIVEMAGDFNVIDAEPNKSINLLEETLSLLEERGQLKAENMTNEVVNEAAKKLYKMDPSLRNVRSLVIKLNNLLPELSKNIVDQDHIHSYLYEGTKQAGAGLHDGRGPRLSLFLDGPPGVGKTEVFKEYAKVMQLPLERIEMNQFKAGTGKTIDDLMAQIAKAVRKNAFAIILLDEIEKADPKILEGLLAAMDSDRFTYYEDVGGGKKKAQKLSLKNTTVGMTSNAIGDLVSYFINNLPADKKNLGHRKLRELFYQQYKDSDLVDMIVEKGIPRPLLDRVKIKTVAFPPTPNGLKRLLRMKIESRNKDAQKRMKIETDVENMERYIDKLVIKARQKGLSTRETISIATEHFNRLASDIILRPDYEIGKKFTIDLAGDIKQRWQNRAMQCSRVFQK